ncbi:toll/interleukin-1 receptor domain-containing protein [Periweissella fabalis]|uniref:Toll/interleukin-1 receptor domain-containing protein n=1 Tax=Periweissella fabalis TaxID=1070421 RepID=A0A7X6N5L6_9LACO|nr:toll/interleukin-1 receptor domain-containing protein [Periweissella fabalis]MCM0598451.1 toll/interleukin-1 receptor domain-containing protein [Periweissella fabalis]NKZ25064.1 toll/interleukin-1 receptor domain-containing protein [Periweissella fabalis]
MAQCTAPVNGHRSAAARANCPVCGGRGGYSSYGYSGYSDHSRSYSSPSRNRTSSLTSGNKTRAKWSSSSSTILYTPAEIKALTPLRNEVEKRAKIDLKDIFLCHAWEDRKTTAKNLTDLLVGNGTSVWFSENEVLLGSNLLREIDKGLVNSRVGIVLVTQSFLKRIKGNGIADKELSALLSRDQLIPVLDGVTFEELVDVSPLLASRSGLNTSEETIEDIADKLSEVVSV